jgi:NHLM bacteriocin system ABC transporter peptidase/ATP-binding protein
MEATECGAASLSMIFAYFGKHMALEQMRIETGVSRDGCNAGNIMRAAKKYGLDCHGYRREPEALRAIKTPCVIHWNFNHFVVFEGIKGQTAYLNDPASGRRRLTLDELDEGFTGIVLTFEITDRFVKSKAPRKLSGLIKTRLAGQYGILFKLVYIGLLLVFPGLILPVLSQLFMDDVLVGGNTSWFTQLLFFMAAAIVLKAGLSFYRAQILLRLANKLSLLSGHAFLQRLFRLPISFFDQRYAGDLASRVESNDSISAFLAGELAQTVLNIIVAAFYLILLLIYNVWLTLIGLISVAVSLVIVKLSSKAISDLSMKLQQDSGKYAGALVAGLSITSTLKAAGGENEYVARVIGYNAKAIRLEQRLGRLQHIVNALPESIGRITDVIMLILGAVFVIHGHMTIGMLFAFTSLFDSFTAPINSLVGFIESIQGLKANMNRVDDILTYAPDAKFADEGARAERTGKPAGRVELADISFGYGVLDKPLIERFSFKLNAGQSVAFVGSSGCGKSTVSKVISGLYQPWGGELLLDGIPMDTLPNEILNAGIATVSQNITLFSGTIRDNLTMWNSAILMPDLIAAAKDACIHDVITAKPGAYDYPLDEGGANLSGGQRQRLEIARALAINPSILIMDEATSALDPLVEKRILDNIKRRGCTCIIVAHRLSAIRDCDEIIVMERGKIVQRGTHEQLRGMAGAYREFMEI